MKRKLLIGGAVVTGLVVTGVLAATLLVDANRFRGTLEAQMESVLGRKVALGHLEVAILSGGISVDDVSIADDPAFGAAPFVKARAVTIGVDLIPLIFSRSLRVQSFHLEQPELVLIHTKSGQWNFSSVGPASASTAGGGGPAAAMSVLVRKITIAHGRVVIGEATSRGSDRAYEDVTLEATDLSFTSAFPFRASAKLPGRGTIGLKGQAGPLAVQDAATTPIRTTVDIQGLDIATTGVVDPASGLAGVLDYAGTLASDGRRTSSKGKLHATKLQVVPGGAPSKVPIDVEYESTYDLKGRSGVLEQGDVHVGKAIARLTGTYRAADATTAVRMRLSGKAMPVSELGAALPAIAVTLPGGVSLQDGTIDLELAIDGPIDRLRIDGPIAMSNTTVKGFDLGSNMSAVASFAALPRNADTFIETLSSGLHLSPEGVRADSISFIVPAIGTLTGAGRIATSGAMDFRMLARLQESNRVVGELARVTSLGQPENGIPFRIQGTTTNPVFVPDVSGAVTNVLKNPQTQKDAAGILGRIFGRKK